MLRTARGAAALALCLAACAPPPSPWTGAQAERLPLRAKVAQMVAPALYVGADARPRQDSALARRLSAEGVGGVRLLPGTAGVARRRVALLAAASRLPLLVIADLDRGVGGTLAGAPELPPPATLAGWDDARVEDAATAAAEAARAVGINAGLLSAPAFPDPHRVPAPAGAAADAAFAQFAETLAGRGLLVGVRAFSPGPGAPDTAVAVLPWDRAAVEALQLDRLRVLLERGVGAVKPATVALPSLTRDSVPLPENPVFVQGTLRRDLGFGGLVVEDLAPVTPAVRRYGAAEAAVRAVQAGADLLVGMDDARGTIDAVVAAVESGRIPRDRIDQALRRIFAAKEALGLGMGDDAPADAVPAADAEEAETVLEAHTAALTLLGAPPAAALRGCRGVVLVTVPGVDAAPLSAALGGRIPGMGHLQALRVPRRGPLSRRADFAGRDAQCAVVAAFPGARPEVVERVVEAVPRPDSAALDTLPPAARAALARDTAARAALARDTAARAALARDTAARRIVWIDFFPGADDFPPAASSVVLARGTGAAAQRAAGLAVATRGEAAAPPEGAAWPPAPVLAVGGAAEAGMSADSLAAVDRIMRAALAEGVFSGAAVAIGRRGRLVRLRGYGVTGGRPVDPRTTRFDIASLSKVVGTTSAALLMVEDGVDLDEPVRRYVSGFRGDGRSDVILRQLLTHSSGLSAGAWLFGSASSPEEAVRQVTRARMVTAPGETVRYSDFGMILMKEAVEARAERPMDRLLADRVFGPLGMARTLYLPPVGWQDETVPTALPAERPYVLDAVVHDGNAFRLGGVAGHAGLFSTAWDLSVFSQTMLNRGAYGTRRVFSPGLVDAFTRRRVETRALGWDTPADRSSAGRYLSTRAYGHTGYTGTSIWIDPALDLFVVILTNRTFREASSGEMLRVRAAVADAAARSIIDRPVAPRPRTGR